MIYLLRVFVVCKLKDNNFKTTHLLDYTQQKASRRRTYSLQE